VGHFRSFWAEEVPGYAPELNPDELVWSYAKRTDRARRPLQRGEKPAPRVAAQLAEIGYNPALVRAFCRHPRCYLL
jgi:transposase